MNISPRARTWLIGGGVFAVGYLGYKYFIANQSADSNYQNVYTPYPIYSAGGTMGAGGDTISTPTDSTANSGFYDQLLSLISTQGLTDNGSGLDLTALNSEYMGQDFALAQQQQQNDFSTTMQGMQYAYGLNSQDIGSGFLTSGMGLAFPLGAPSGAIGFDARYNPSGTSGGFSTMFQWLMGGNASIPYTQNQWLNMTAGQRESARTQLSSQQQTDLWNSFTPAQHDILIASNSAYGSQTQHDVSTPYTASQWASMSAADRSAARGNMTAEQQVALWNQLTPIQQQRLTSS